MKFHVNEGCIGCGLCAGTCPKVFSTNEEGYAEAIDEEVSDEDIADALEAKESCPVSAIEEK